MAWAAIAAQGFVGHFSDMRTSHHHRNAHRADGVRHLIGLPDHPRHRTNAHQSDLLLPDVLRQFCHGKTLRIPVYEKHFMFWRREGFEKKHPEVRHEVVGDFVVWVIEQNLHLVFASAHEVSCGADFRRNGAIWVAVAVGQGNTPHQSFVPEYGNLVQPYLGTG